jgi:hypothetical protein
MSFGKLLATGKCIVSGREHGRYRVNSRASLPKFISPKNPFVQSPNKDASAQTVTPEATAGNLSHQAAETGARVATPSTPLKSATRASVWTLATGWLAGALKKINPPLCRAHAAPHTNSTVPRFDKQPVQGELSLDHVRVMRNDLSDADLEVVTIGAAGAAARTAPTENTWGRLTSRVFGAETV